VAWLRLTNLGLAYLKLGLLDAAHATAQRAVAMCDDAGALGLGARVLMSRVELRRGELDQAHAILSGLLDDPDPLVGEGELVAPALAMVRCCVLGGDHGTAETWSKWASGVASSVKLPLVYPLAQVSWALTHLAAGRYDDAHKRLRYPLEHMALLADTSAQEILALRAAAAHGLGDRNAAQAWIAKAYAVVQEQANRIQDAEHRASFVDNIPLHRVITRAAQGAAWSPIDILQP
jgi:tetratricopeptide (TPR) repeat protein